MDSTDQSLVEYYVFRRNLGWDNSEPNYVLQTQDEGAVCQYIPEQFNDFLEFVLKKIARDTFYLINDVPSRHGHRGCRTYPEYTPLDLNEMATLVGRLALSNAETNKVQVLCSGRVPYVVKPIKH